MAEQSDFADYKNLSDLKNELEGLKGKKDISVKDLHDAVQKLAFTVSDMLEVFAAAAEQMKLEEKEYENSQKKHEMIVQKLDKLIDQNRTIAEGMVAVVEMIKEETKESGHREFEPKPEPKIAKPEAKEWIKPQPSFMQQMRQPPQMPQAPQQMPMMPPISAGQQDSMPAPVFGSELPPMGPSEDIELPEDLNLDDEGPKKKGILGMFKK